MRFPKQSEKSLVSPVGGERQLIKAILNRRVTSSSILAGKKWGAMYIPRLGQEVVVEFLAGDPDRPIITGRVYNDQVMPPLPVRFTPVSS